jgi:UPF0755 protein
MKIIKKIIHRNRKRMFFAAVGLFIFMILYLLFYALTPVTGRKITSVVNIPKGTSFIESVDILETSGLVRQRYMFYLLVISKNVHRHIRAGEYELSTSMSPMDILNKLVRGEIKSYPITIPEDFTLREIADRLVFYKLVDKKTFMDFASNLKFLRTLKIEGPSLEGYLYPETYQLDRSMDTREIIKIMVYKF